MSKNLIVFMALLLLALPAVLAQDQQELAAEREQNARVKGLDPIGDLMKSVRPALRKELEGVHPRVFVTDAELDALRAKAKSEPELWKTAIARVRALGGNPPPPPAETRRAQNEVGLAIAEAAFVYKITGDKKYLDAAKKYMDAAVSYDVWGYSYNKPDVDLAAGHLLYGLGWAYDLLYRDLTPAERDKYRAKLVRQARLMFDYFKPKKGKTYAYSQNHTFIPIAGLGVAAYALMGEEKEAGDWAALSRAIFDRVLATYSGDGYYYEGMEYWIFSMPWIAHYLDAHLHATGEDLYKGNKGLMSAHTFVAHATLPGGEFNFDFGDIYAGPTTRARKGEDYERERVDGHFRTNYNILYNLAVRYGNGEAQGVADWLKSKGQVNAEEYWTFIWHDASVKTVPIDKQPLWHYFPDHDVVFWRSSWTNDAATAFAFKCGPPEGHAALGAINKFPEWRLSSGHAHPDAASFIIWSNGKYLTGDSGYAGVPLTVHHNTLLFDGMGQNREGKGHDVWIGIPYERLDKIRLTSVRASASKVSIVADATAAYEPEVGLKRFVRKFEFTAPGGFVVTDDVALEKPRTVTSILHADNTIDVLGGGLFDFEKGALRATVKGDYDTRVEPNDLTAPGRPGSVDKGEREVRGVRLAISTKKKVTAAKMVVKLSIKQKGK